MSNINKITLEQEFKLANYKSEITKLNTNQTKTYLTQILKQMMIKDNLIKFYIRISIT
uniref:Uncharacterized protein ycf18 n=1 Tax=Sonderella linearis TaxID=110477 RepID=A0A1Z1MLM5_9FLOR|nr:phycobilisome degradation protein [Sonderella linearis]ARW66997.1 phycobilisome degradation protein [Sonderella linearis]